MHQGFKDYKNPLEEYIDKRLIELQATFNAATQMNIEVYRFAIEDFSGKWKWAKQPYLQYIALDTLLYGFRGKEMTEEVFLGVYDRWLLQKSRDKEQTHEALFQQSFYECSGDVLPMLRQLIHQIKPPCQTREIEDDFIMVSYHASDHRF